MGRYPETNVERVLEHECPWRRWVAGEVRLALASKLESSSSKGSASDTGDLGLLARPRSRSALRSN